MLYIIIAVVWVASVVGAFGYGAKIGAAGKEKLISEMNEFIDKVDGDLDALGDKLENRRDEIRAKLKTELRELRAKLREKLGI